jgi:hypothetical protein
MTDEHVTDTVEIDGEELPIDSREVLQRVREAAGWRVSPRHIEAAAQAFAEIDETPSVARLAQVVSAFHGERSQRQRRNADLWRLFGAQLAVRGKPCTPEAQQEFIGRAKARTDARVSDGDLLLVATSLGSANHPLTPEVTADVTTWLSEQFGTEFESDAVEERLDQAVEAAMAARAERAARRRRGS